MPTLPTAPYFVKANGISIAVREAGSGPPILLLHGFPELSYSWRIQVAALSDAGWRAIAPDLRGYGDTGAHGGVKAYSMRNLVKDMLDMLDAMEIAQTTLIGHDFGGALAWSMARDHPDRVNGIISLNTPYTRRGTAGLPEIVRKHRGKDHYMVSFQRPGVAEALLAADVAATFRALMRRPATSLEGFYRASERLQSLPMTLFTGEPEVMGSPLLSDDDLQHYIDAFRRGGFTGPLNWYRNLHQNWLDTAGSEDMVRVPALMISAADDFFLPPTTTRGMLEHVPDVEFHVVQDCGHWIQCEKPAETNALILDWLERRIRPRV